MKLSLRWKLFQIWLTKAWLESSCANWRTAWSASGSGSKCDHRGNIFLLAASSPVPEACWRVRRLPGGACWPCARPGGASRTVSRWRSILQMTPRRRKTQAGELREVSERKNIESRGNQICVGKKKAGLEFLFLQCCCSVCFYSNYINHSPLER